MNAENPALTLRGIRIFESEHAIVITDTPVRRHARKPWMAGRAYHDRVQKKWGKRFGYEWGPGMFKTSLGLIVHPSVMPKLREAIALQGRVQ